MELFAKLFGSLLVFVYHCFDRIVIHGYLSGLSRPEQVVYFFRNVVGVPVVDKEVLSQRTNHYQKWVEAFARNHQTPIEWAEKGVRKEDHVRSVADNLASNPRHCEAEASSHRNEIGKNAREKACLPENPQNRRLREAYTEWPHLMPFVRTTMAVRMG